MKQSLLLTGGTGFLGSHLLRRLIRDGHSVVLAKRSFSDTWRIRDLEGRYAAYDLDRDPLDRIFAEHRIGTILHSATNYGRREIPPTEIVDSNLILPLHLLQLGEKHGTRAFINTDTLLDKRVSHYSLSKKQFLDWLKLYSDRLLCVNVALTHFYGPHDDGSKFVTQMIRDLLVARPSIPLTPGRQKRDMLHVDDVVSAFVRLIDHSASQGPSFHAYDVGSGESRELREIVQTLQTLSGNSTTKLDFGALDYRPNEAMDIQVQARELRALGWRPTLTLEQGLSLTLESERKQAKPA